MVESQGTSMDLSVLVQLALIYSGKKQKKIYPEGITRLKWELGTWSYLCQGEEEGGLGRDTLNHTMGT